MYMLTVLPLVLTSFILTPMVAVNFFYLKSLALFSYDLLSEVIEDANATQDAITELVEHLETKLTSEHITLKTLFSQWARGYHTVSLKDRTSETLHVHCFRPHYHAMLTCCFYFSGPFR
jgi:hypothetical protein